MDKNNLDKKLIGWIKELPKESKKSLLDHLGSLKSVYPFNEYEYRLMYLLDKRIITFEEYGELRKAYVGSNPYLNLYSISPRAFGEIWAQQHLINIDASFIKPSKEVDKKYSGEYDLYLENENKIIKIEVKACRAINTKLRGSLETKALGFDSNEPYWMNFQQIKLDIADTFIFVGVWVDKLLYWVLTNKEVKKHPLQSHQHRGGIEYQIGITQKNIKEFEKFLVQSNLLASTIQSKFNVR